MTKGKLQSEKTQLQKELKDPNLPKDVRDVIETAIKEIDRRLDAGESIGGAAPAKTAKAGKQAKGAASKKGPSPLENCREILAKYKHEKATGKKRIAKRKRSGKGPELTVNETLKKAAKTVGKKVEKTEKQGKKFNAESAVNGIREILESVFSNTEKGEGEEFLKVLMQMMREVAKKHGHKVKGYAQGGVTDDDLYGWDYKSEVITGTDAAERAEKLKEKFEAQGYIVNVRRIEDLDNVYHVNAEKRRKQIAGNGMHIPAGGKEPRQFSYIIDLNERGGFRAHVEDENGEDVFTILAGDELGEDETSIFDDGWMKNINDLTGLENYLKELNIIGAHDEVVEPNAEEGIQVSTGDEHPAGSNMRIYYYRTQNFDVCPEAEEMFNNILKHPGSDTGRNLIVGVARELDLFLGIIKKDREAGNATAQEVINATGHIMKAMYMLYPVLTKMLGADGDPTSYYPRFVGPYMAELAGFDKKGRGGRIKSAISRDRSYQSQEPHEMKYMRKTTPKHPKYNKKANGGGVKFKDKVKAISASLTGKKVPPKYQSQYGKSYNTAEAKAAAKRIAGSMEKGRKKARKKLFGGIITVRSIDNLEAHSGDANFPN